MNQVHLHLLLNHVAILGTLFSTVVLVLGLWQKQTAIKNLSLYGLIFSALVVIPVFRTGEPAEEAVEEMVGVSEQTIHDHEESAEIALWLVLASGGAALLVLVLPRISSFRTERYMFVVLLVALAASVSISYTGLQGGKIRHSEIRTQSNSGVQTPEPGAENGPAGIEEEDDD